MTTERELREFVRRGQAAQEAADKATQTQHTPLPWKADGTLIMPQDEEDGGYVADVYGDSIEHRGANIAIIVRACNAHDDLVAALKKCDKHLSGCGSMDADRIRHDGLCREVRAALAKASA